ncbi:DUF6596 domain-containing protein [Streptomyces sp. NPDC002952]|uniref:DUF6596 domain-containing protein n=1 Tax=Streptomyces sp. NPDC002952 TaxID=3364673 RepID=UPI003683E76A
MRSQRLPAVLAVLYLLFTEGYAATAGPTQIRPELCSEAIRLAHILHRLLPDEAETTALLALMLLTRRPPPRPHHSRRPAGHARGPGPHPVGPTADRRRSPTGHHRPAH